MAKSARELFNQANDLSSQANALFAERDALFQQAAQEKIEYTHLQIEVDALKAQADALAAEFKQLYQAASAAFAADDGAQAKGLSLQGHAVQAQCMELNAQCSSLISTLSQKSQTIHALYEDAHERNHQAKTKIQEAQQLRSKARELQHYERVRQSSRIQSIEDIHRLLSDNRCHVIRDHVGKTVPDLKQRLTRRPYLSTVSSFTKIELAEQVLFTALKHDHERIITWLTTTNDPKLWVRYKGQRPIGYALPRTTLVVNPATRADILLVRDISRQHGYYIVSAWPVLK